MSETRHVAVFLFLEKDGQFLTMRRANTGYMDGRIFPVGLNGIHHLPGRQTRVSWK